MMDIVFLAVGIIVGLVAGILFATRKADATLESRVSNRLDELRDETVDKTKKRVEVELREELTGTVREELKEKYDEEIKQAAQQRADRKLEEAESKAKAVTKQAELDAKSIALEAQQEAEKELKERRAELQKLEQRLTKREANLDERASKLDERDEETTRREERLNDRQMKLNERDEAISRQEATVQKRLEEVSGYSAERAKEELVDSLVAEAKTEATQKVRELEEQAMDEADRRAKKVLATAIQRYAGEYVTERTVKVVQLPSDDMKGRIIGREGRNIRALEAATGIDVIVDDTPEVVVVSGFDPVRREIARLSLEKLIADGRIHPARIEEVVEKTEQEIGQVIKDAGEQAAFELGVHGLHPEIIKLLGRLKWRTSYGQNMWSHSIEVGFLCGLMADELGVDVKLARRAGLLHDMGKALTHEREGSHALVGAEIAKKHGEVEIVRNAIAAHHDDEPQNSVIAHLVIAADALSGARPGARREILGTYVKRLEELERISLDFDGVDKTYAIQAGREIRVMVSNSKVNDDQAYTLSKEIARKIEDELTYPGQVKVCVIRETRAVDYAK